MNPLQINDHNATSYVPLENETEMRPNEPWFAWNFTQAQVRSIVLINIIVITIFFFCLVCLRHGIKTVYDKLWCRKNEQERSQGSAEEHR